MKLPVMPPVSPMLAKSVPTIPSGASYEPKWDGFRSICFRDGDEVELGSRNERPLTRYFPELVDAVTAELPERCVIDGEIIIATNHELDFEALQQRIHPADSRVRMLAKQTPASFVAFDLLALGDDDYTGRTVRRAARRTRRRAGRLRAVGPRHSGDDGSRRPRIGGSTSSRGRVSTAWSPSRSTVTYQPDKRVMFKIKHERTADCVVAGYRVHKSGADAIGSLLLGLYNDDGTLASVGVIGAFPMARRAQLFTEMQPLVTSFDDHPVELGGPGAADPELARKNAVARGGTPARTCRSCRCAPSGWSRSATTTWKANGSGTPRSSTGGGRTGTPGRARSSSSSGRDLQPRRHHSGVSRGQWLR